MLIGDVLKAKSHLEATESSQDVITVPLPAGGGDKQSRWRGTPLLFESFTKWLHKCYNNGGKHIL